MIHAPKKSRHSLAVCVILSRYMNWLVWAKKNSITTALGVALVCALVACLSIWLTYNHLPCSPYLDPDITCDPTQVQVGISRDIRNAVDEQIFAQKKAGKVTAVSVYYQSLNSDQWFSLYNSMLYQPASLSKVPLMMWFYSLAENDPELLDRELDYQQGSLSMPQHFDFGGVQPGNTYTVSQLIDSMITKSDNNAAYALVSLLTPQDQLNLFSDFDFRKSRTATSTTSFTDEYRLDVKSLATQYRMLYDASYLTPQDSEKALKLLALSKFRAGLAAGVPDGTIVAAKFGERQNSDGSEQIHDCGVIYAPSHPYILCVMTRGQDPDVLAGVIASISKIVYSKVEANQ